MRVRLMTRADIPACVTISNDSFLDDDMFDLICPRRAEYPLGFRKYNAERVRGRFISPGRWCVVCVEDSPNSETGAKEEILGFALWNRASTGRSPYSNSPNVRHNETFLNRIERLLSSLEESYAWHLRLNPAIDYKAAAEMHGNPPREFGPLHDHWRLGSLNVSPKHQRKGVGAMLVTWGMERCREEGAALGMAPLPAVLISSRMGQGLYTKMGFKILTWFGQEYGFTGGAVMVWDEQMKWVKMVGDGDVKVTKNGRPIEIVFRGSDEDAAVNAEELAQQYQAGSDGDEGRTMQLSNSKEVEDMVVAVVTEVAS